MGGQAGGGTDVPPPREQLGRVEELRRRAAEHRERAAVLRARAADRRTRAQRLVGLGQGAGEGRTPTDSQRTLQAHARIIAEEARRRLEELGAVDIGQPDRAADEKMPAAGPQDSAVVWERHAQEWDELAQEWEQLATERDTFADERDHEADERDRVGDERDRIADQREEAEDERELRAHDRESGDAS